MKLLKQFDGLLKNQFALYGVVFLSIVNIFGYVMTRNYDAVAFFVLVFYLTTQYTKNNILVALIAMGATNLLLTIIKGRKVYESFKEGGEDGGEGEAAAEKEESTDDADVVVDTDATAAANVESVSENMDSGKVNEHMANLNRIEKLLNKQEGLVGHLGKIDGMLNRLQKMGAGMSKKGAK